MFQPEETVHVPATDTPDSVHVPVNIYADYYPVYYHVLPPDFYPKLPRVKIAVKECFFPSPQPPQNHQPILPRRKSILVHNDGGRGITVSKLLGERAMYPPKTWSLPKHVSPPKPVSLPKPVFPPKPVSLPKPVFPPKPVSKQTCISAQICVSTQTCISAQTCVSTQTCVSAQTCVSTQTCVFL
ncbi:anti-sigma-I factor RsgI2-like [Tachysurus fulvidraco]|uniref:anti-sigma-I factor RsgI2-like n=1 Tax=Tachysurus fulvidraco TaxID=1234273 RepID=UPI000F4FEA74|nr:anti-sigma-I factor RsgI2-like [Tachysurus fulvidraco]